MVKTYLEAVRKPGQTVNPLFAFLGLEVVSIEPDNAVLRLFAKPELTQGVGLVGGGILAALLDETMAHSVLSDFPNDRRTTTVDMSVSYLRPVKPGDIMECEARVIKRGGRVIFVEAAIRVNDIDVARSKGSFLLL